MSSYTYYMSQKFITARDIPQILLLLGIFVCKKLLIKYCCFFRKIKLTLWKHRSTRSKTPENTLFVENTSRFWIKRVWKFCIFEKVHFFHFFPNPQILFLIKSIGVDQVLTKIFQIDPKLTFNVFHILNHGRISKIEKNIWWYRTPQKKGLFLGGGLGA